MLKSLFIILTLFSLQLKASVPCIEQDPNWVTVDASEPLAMVLRANARHYWSWAKSHDNLLLPQSLFNDIVVVTGDPHHENFSHIFSQGHRVLVLNDLDDVGRAPAFLDFIKFVTVSRAVIEDESQLSTKKMLQSYINGVSEKNKDYQQVASESLPQLLKQDYLVSPQQSFEDYQKKIMDETSDKKFKADDEMLAWQSLNSQQRKAFLDLEAQIFLKSLPMGFNETEAILDRAHLVKLHGGGSLGLLRYLYLLENNEHYQLIEFKPLEAPAVQAYCKDQPHSLARAQKALAVYWPQQYPKEFAIVGPSQQAYFMRPKLKKYVSFSIKDFQAVANDFAELSYYLAYHLGQKHGQQMTNSKNYVQRMQQQTQLAQQVGHGVTAYLEAVNKQLHCSSLD